jgi:tetratricopeptide (TPR) repeat protein
MLGLAISLGVKFRQTKAINHLNTAIRIQDFALALMPKDDPMRLEWLNSLVAFFGTTYTATWAIPALHQEIDILRELLKETHELDEARSRHLGRLSECLYERHFRRNNLADLEEAVSLAGDAVQAAKPGTKWRIERLMNHIHYLSELAKVLKDSASEYDFGTAVSVARRAVDESASERPEFQARLLFSLAVLLEEQYWRLDNVKDLDHALDIARKSLDLTPKDDSSRTLRLEYVADLVEERYEKLGNITDLYETIQLSKLTLEVSLEETGENLSMRLHELGVRLESVFRVTGDISILDEAIDLATQAINHTTVNSWGIEGARYDIGRWYGLRFGKTRNEEDLHASHLHYRRCFDQTDGRPSTRIHASAALMFHFVREQEWKQAYAEAQRFIPLMPLIAPWTMLDRIGPMREMAGLASSAAAVALQAGESPSIALQFLEQGRRVVASSFDDVRAMVPQKLQQDHPDLVSRYVALREEVSRSDHIYREDGLDVMPGSRYEELDEAIAAIRQQPGFGDFLRASSEASMLAAASAGPVVIVNLSSLRCDAIILEQEQIRALALPQLRLQDAFDMLRNHRPGSQNVLEWLWDIVAQPILAALGINRRPEAGIDPPHIWWIPTGVLTSFPIHAAGYHSVDSDDTVLDRVVSSYSSSIRTIIDGRNQPLAASESQLPSSATTKKAILVAMPKTPGHSALPFAGREVDVVRELCNQMELQSVEPPPRKKEVASYLPACHIFHFAGHGSTNTKDARKSQLLLEDWREDGLDAASLQDMNFRRGNGPFLAYLSACGTGRVKDMSLLDEGVHLISACQVAGFRHVIGTMWEVPDEQSVDMARLTYEHLSSMGLKDEAVPRALRKAALELRHRWLKDLTTSAIDRGAVPGSSSRTLSALESKRSATGGEGEENNGGTRTIIVCEGDDGNIDVRAMQWVPYVHFGV